MAKRLVLFTGSGRNQGFLIRPNKEAGKGFTVDDLSNTVKDRKGFPYHLAGGSKHEQAGGFWVFEGEVTDSGWGEKWNGTWRRGFPADLVGMGLTIGAGPHSDVAAPVGAAQPAQPLVQRLARGLPRRSKKPVRKVKKSARMRCRTLLKVKMTRNA